MKHITPFQTNPDLTNSGGGAAGKSISSQLLLSFTPGPKRIEIAGFVSATFRIISASSSKSCQPCAHLHGDLYQPRILCRSFLSMLIFTNSCHSGSLPRYNATGSCLVVPGKGMNIEPSSSSSSSSCFSFFSFAGRSCRTSSAAWLRGWRTSLEYNPTQPYIVRRVTSIVLCAHSQKTVDFFVD